MSAAYSLYEIDPYLTKLEAFVMASHAAPGGLANGNGIVLGSSSPKKVAHFSVSVSATLTTLLVIP
ncbi:hypothetical protein F4680DRAFT_433822 [Xylaria scruposa]|nr:hypothetical protein F4680DRAFT_433822 [Xylaria scruposa]